MQQHFRYISRIAESFFSQENIVKKLHNIQLHDITGWELWMHVELSIFLKNQKPQPEFYREEKIFYDKRKEKTKLYMRPDFIISNPALGMGRIILEIKQDPELKDCIRKMWADLEKISAARQSHAQMESFWLLGVYQLNSSFSQGKLTRQFNEYIEELGGLANPKMKLCKKIEGTGMGYVIF